jgi:hypothetical protein
VAQVIDAEFTRLASGALADETETRQESTDVEIPAQNVACAAAE